MSLVVVVVAVMGVCGVSCGGGCGCTRSQLW